MQSIIRRIVFSTCAIALTLPLHAASLTLLPSADVTGDPGSVAGWGVIFIPDQWSVLTFSEFLPQGEPAGVLGNYGDYISLPQNYYDLPPGFPLISYWDPAAESGIGGFDISPGVQPGTIISGIIRLHYDTYLFDPDFGGPSQILDNTIDVAASITVTAPAAPTGTPEPRFGWSVGICIASFLILRTRNGCQFGLGQHREEHK